MKQASNSRPAFDRRREQRFPHGLAEVRHHSLIAVPRNLSRRGLALETTRGLLIGNRYRLELHTPWAVTRVEATVRWCRLHAIRRFSQGSDFEPLFLAGLEFDAPIPMGHTVVLPDDASTEGGSPGTAHRAKLKDLEATASASPP